MFVFPPQQSPKSWKWISIKIGHLSQRKNKLNCCNCPYKPNKHGTNVCKSQFYEAKCFWMWSFGIWKTFLNDIILHETNKGDANAWCETCCFLFLAFALFIEKTEGKKEESVLNFGVCYTLYVKWIAPDTYLTLLTIIRPEIWRRRRDQRRS